MEKFTKYLNPVYKQLPYISNIEEIIPKTPIEEEEYPHLIKLIRQSKSDIDKGFITMNTLAEQIEFYLQLINNETGDDKEDAKKVYNNLIREMEVLVERVNRYLDSLDSPYFGKIIFKYTDPANATKEPLPVYIGKFGYFDETTNKLLVSDWRSPIANLYYEYSSPTNKVSFESPVGTQNGDITQKRQYDIANGRFNIIYDIKSGNSAADQYLYGQLNKREGKKLEEIVATIQTQQNDIIRDKIDKPIVIQGVAGSGKTTIILHRLAYLFYTYPEKIRPENSLIIAPNAVFLDYISDVLPSLGVKGIKQDTFIYWAREILRFEDKHVLDSSESEDVLHFKGSNEFLQIIREYIEYFEQKFFLEMPTSVSVDVEEMYYELKEKTPTISMKELVDLATEGTFMRRKFTSKPDFGDSKKSDGERSRISKISEYKSKSLSTYAVYKEMFRDSSFFPSDKVEKKLWEKVKKQSASIFSKQKGFKGYSMNDLAAMVIIHRYIHGTDENLRDYILVDEAQDLTPIQIYALLLYARNGNITLAGDTAQAIIPPYHITDWNFILDLLEEQTGNTPNYHILSRSYRSTAQIIQFANGIIKGSFPDSYSLPEAVLRNGDEVSIHYNRDSSDQNLEQLLRLVKDEIESEKPSIAIITKSEEESDTIFDFLSDKQLDYQIYSYQDENFHSGIQVLPVKYAKGLEFDTVIVWDLSAKNYSTSDDARLIYVAMTRALNKLHTMIDKKKPSPLLPKKLLSNL